MKRIIYSLFNDITVPHQSAPESKQEQFRKYKDKLIERQTQYAQHCGAEYIHYNPKISNYDDIQFEKLFKFYELLEEYDEVLYLDLDVIPKTKENFFEYHNLDNLCCTAYVTVDMDSKPKREKFVHAMNEGYLDPMHLYVKGALKISMLLLDGITSDNFVINTGVLGGNKKSIEGHNFNLEEIRKVYIEALNDNVYPPEMSDLFRENNEVFFTYFLEKNNIKWNDITLSWNFILDSKVKEFSPACHFVHQVNKEFESTFNAISSI